MAKFRLHYLLSSGKAQTVVEADGPEAAKIIVRSRFAQNESVIFQKVKRVK